MICAGTTMMLPVNDASGGGVTHVTLLWTHDEFARVVECWSRWMIAFATASGLSGYLRLVLDETRARTLAGRSKRDPMTSNATRRIDLVLSTAQHAHLQSLRQTAADTNSTIVLASVMAHDAKLAIGGNKGACPGSSREPCGWEGV